MTPKRIVAKMANSLLGHFGLTLAKNDHDLDARLESSRHLEFVFDDLADPIEQWINCQQLFTCGKPILVRSAVENFYYQYLASPFRAHVTVSRFNNLLWLYLIAKVFEPTFIVDSGTYTGASAWALSLACPDSPLYSFDIDLSRLKLRSPGVRYIQADWTTLDAKECDFSHGLCYFDDHVDQIGRLLQAAERGFPLAIFDDDFPVTSFAPMAHDGTALPKIEFALDDRIRDKEIISWSNHGQPYSWQVDRGYLDKGRQAIRATERLPDTSPITGIHQTPYRLVALKENGLSSLKNTPERPNGIS